MRNQIGKANNNAKIDEATAAKVKGLHLLGVRQTLIASTLGLKRANVWPIVHGASWQETLPDTSVTAPIVSPRQSKLCPLCNTEKPKAEFMTRANTSDGFGPYCYECNRLKNSRNLRALREKVISKLGSKCACCGEDTFEFLAIDHVYDDGAECRSKTSENNRTIFYIAILEGTYSSKVQLLCHNCNSAKGFYGSCPHKKISKFVTGDQSGYAEPEEVEAD